MFIGNIVDRMDTYLPTSHLQSMKTSKTKYMTGLMDKAIVKVNQN
jgi:hypothetical protein